MVVMEGVVVVKVVVEVAAVLYCTVYCAVLYCTVYCAVLYCIILYCSAMQQGSLEKPPTTLFVHTGM